jgi:hypothetical protein
MQVCAEVICAQWEAGQARVVASGCPRSPGAHRRGHVPSLMMCTEGGAWSRINESRRPDVGSGVLIFINPIFPIQNQHK